MRTDMHTTPKAESQDDQDLVALRARRLQDFRTAALQEESPLRSNLWAEVVDSMEMGQILDKAIKQSLTDAPDVPKRFEEIGFLADAYLRYAKLWSGLIELDRRLDKTPTRGSVSR